LRRFAIFPRIAPVIGRIEASQRARCRGADQAAEFAPSCYQFRVRGCRRGSALKPRRSAEWMSSIETCAHYFVSLQRRTASCLARSPSCSPPPRMPLLRPLFGSQLPLVGSFYCIASDHVGSAPAEMQNRRFLSGRPGAAIALGVHPHWPVRARCARRKVFTQAQLPAGHNCNLLAGYPSRRFLPYSKEKEVWSRAMTPPGAR